VRLFIHSIVVISFSMKILKPAEKKAKYPYGGMNVGRPVPVTPPRKQKKKDSKMG